MDDLTRRDVIKLGAVATVAASLGVADALAQSSSTTFFTADELALVDELSEMIIPADDHSPGARAAKVAAYIDARLAEAFDEKDRSTWRDGLKLVQQLSQTTNGKPFMQVEFGGPVTNPSGTEAALKAYISALKSSGGQGIFYWEPEGYSPFTGYNMVAWNSSTREPTAAMKGFIGS